jgi:hypothetical protein
LEKLIHEAKGNAIHTPRDRKAPVAHDAPGAFPADVIAAWKGAGAEVGWLRANQVEARLQELSFHALSVDKEGEPGDLLFVYAIQHHACRCSLGGLS